MMSGLRNILWLLPLALWFSWPLWGGPVSRFLAPKGGDGGLSGGQVVERPAAAGGGFVMDGVLFTQLKNGVLDWQIQAGRLYSGDNPDLLRLETVEARVFKETEPRFVITGREGEYDSKRKLLLMRDQVSVQTAKGLLVQAASLSYDDQARMISTGEPVRITGRNLEVSGQGLDYDMTDDSYEVGGRVKVDIR